MSKKITVIMVYDNEADTEDTARLASDIVYALAEFGLSPDLITTNAMIVEAPDEPEV